MTNGCLIEAGVLWIGGRAPLRYDAAFRVDKGMIAQIGAMEAVAYGNDHLPRYGSSAMLALPAFVRAPQRAASLEPGSQADLALIGTRSLVSPRAAIAARATDLWLSIEGRLWIEGGRIVGDNVQAALDQYLKGAESMEEAAAFEAARLGIVSAL
jgi:hypothetical protein